MNSQIYRALLIAEIDTGIAFRQARGEKFLDLLREGELHPVIWKTLEADAELIELERASLTAAAEVRVAQWWDREHGEPRDLG